MNWLSLNIRSTWCCKAPTRF